MEAKQYSAGAIFLQVVPVFANVQRAIEDEAKNIDRALGDQMEKSGEKAGERAGKAASKAMSDEMGRAAKNMTDDVERELRTTVDKMEKALGGINTRNLGKKLRAEIKDMRSDLEALSDVDLKVDENFDQTAAKVRALRGQIEDMRKRSKVFFDIEGLPDVYRQIKTLETTIGRIDGTIKVDVDTRDAERKMGAFERNIKGVMSKAGKHIGDGPNRELRRLRDEIEYLGRLRVGIDIGASRLKAEIGEISRELDHLSKNDPEIDVRFEAGKAFAELRAWEIAVDRADGRNIDVDVDVDTGRARSQLNGLTRDGESAANTFRSFNAVILAAAGAGPALIPILAGIAGGLLAIGPAAAVAGFGLSSVLIGFSGIGDAVSALQAQEEELAQTSQQSARTQADSARAVADARRNAARAVESALDQQKAAQERYAESIQDVRDAEEALRQAREAARGTGADIREQISDNQLAQDQGLLDVFNATVTYDATMADGSATNAEQEQARINLEQARDRLEDLRKEARELAKEQRQWRKEGVDGTEEVQDAQDNLNDAIEAQQEAYEALGDAAENVDRARADGARAVADALRNQAQAIEDVSAQQRNVDAAFDKMGLAGKEFSLFLFGLRDEFRDFRDDIQTVLLPAVQEAMEGFLGSESGSVLREAMIALAADFGRFTKALSASFQGEAWLGFFTMLRDLGPDIQKAYGNAFISFLEAMASILTTLAPYALDFALGLERMMGGFADWAASEEGARGIERFMDYAVEIGPEVLDFFGALIGAVANLAVALTPYAETVLAGLTGFLDFIANMDPEVLGIFAAILALITAAQTAYGILSGLLSGAALLASSLGVVIFAVVATGLALAVLYRESEGFRDFINEAWGEIGPAVMEAWEEYIKPALKEWWEAMKELWKRVLVPFFEFLGPIIVEFVKFYLPTFLKVWSFVIRGIAFVVKNILVPVVEGIFWLFGWLYDKLRPVFRDIGEGWDDLMTGMKWVWENVLEPVFDYIANDALDDLRGAFRRTVDAIETIWNGLKRVVGTPIKFVLDTIINNGLIDGFNKVAGWVGMDGFDHIPIPDALQSYATGGIMPGYTPGRDVHAFVSPTAGRLELSGGEAVMRPEWTAAVGPDYVNRMNELARRGGVAAVREAVYGLGGYWMGGILPLLGGSVSSHGSTYPFPAFDLNYPGYADYGKPVKAFKDGRVAQHQYIGDASYGRWVVLNHAGGQNTLYAHLSAFGGPGVGEAVRAGQTVGYVGDLGNTGTPPSSHLHFEIRGGTAGYADAGSKGQNNRSVPGRILDVIKDPAAAVKGWITSGWDKAGAAVMDSPVFDYVKKVPLLAAKKVTDKVWDIVPGWAKSAAGWAGDAANWTIGGVKEAGQAAADLASGVAGAVGDGAGAAADFFGFADGGILPYNGTMMYDNGGYLPPGLTSVVNLTGKPEPVFTNDQWAEMGGGAGGGSIHYEPHFEGSDLTAEDVAGDLNFQFRKMRRGGKYEEVGG